MDYSSIKIFIDLQLNDDWISEKLRAHDLIRFVQDDLGTKSYQLFKTEIQSSTTSSEIDKIRDDYDAFDYNFRRIRELFPINVGEEKKDLFHRAYTRAQNQLSQIYQLLNEREETSATAPPPIGQTELSPISSVDTNNYKFAILWDGNFRWLKNLCKYQNRYNDSEEFRRAALSKGVYRIGNYQVIVEYLDWVCQTNIANPRMQNAIQRWQDDINWLKEKYQYRK